MRVLLIGSGGREHALGWSLTRSGRVTELVSLPGNPGLARLGRVIPGVSPIDAAAVAAVASSHRVDLVVIGPETALAAGVADAVARAHIPVWGPSQAAARLESSKAFAKQVMAEAGVPTADSWVFTDKVAAEIHLRSHPGPYVVKADGLAAGKGVLVTDDREAALAWVSRCFGGGFGEAGSTVVIETYLDGPELSVFAMADGEKATLLEPARDYKRLGDHDTGPNTGGMGSFSPVELAPGLADDVRDRVILPTLRRLAAGGSPYCGFIYAGLCLTAGGPQVIEFNCRLGDPETQVLLPRLETDLVEMIEAGLAGRLTAPVWSSETVTNVVLAAPGYPTAPRIGAPISGVDRVPDDVLVFHAGTALTGTGDLVTAGGRVLNLVGRGANLEASRLRAYAGVAAIGFAGRQYRSDIGRAG